MSDPLCKRCNQPRSDHGIEPPYDLVYGDDEYCESFSYVAAQPTGEAGAEPQRLQTALFKLRDWLMRWELVDRPDSNTALQIAVDQLFDPEENCGILELLAERVSSPRSVLLLNELFQLVNRLWEAEPLDSEKERYLHGLKVKIIAERDAEPSPRSAEAQQKLTEIRSRLGLSKMPQSEYWAGIYAEDIDWLLKEFDGEGVLELDSSGHAHGHGKLVTSPSIQDSAALPGQPSPAPDHVIDVAVARIAEEEGWNLPDADLIEFGAKVYKEAERMARPSQPSEGLEQLLDELCVTPDKTWCQRGRTELREILARHFSGGKSDCCGDAHLELEAAFVMLADIGFERETIQRDGYKEIVWRNKYMPVSGGKGAELKCGKFAASFIPRRGEFFACVLNAGHDGPCRPGGECYTHGEYIGEPNKVPQCPKWPECITEAALSDSAQEPKNNSK